MGMFFVMDVSRFQWFFFKNIHGKYIKNQEKNSLYYTHVIILYGCEYNYLIMLINKNVSHIG